MQLGLEPLALYGLYRLGLATGHYRRVERRDSEAGKGPRTLKPLFVMPGREELAKLRGEQGQAVLLREANEVVGGRVRLFGDQPAPLRLTFETPLKHWTEYERGKASIPFAGFPVEDIKFVWEPARFGWAFVLGRAFQLSGEEKYAEAFWKYFEQFAEGNPAYLGPHWMNGQEVALRLMALVWAAQAFEGATASSAERCARLVESIREHARRIPPTLVYARAQDNNHLVTESAALFTAGAALDQEAWRATGWSWLNRALQRQISSYGEYIQHSTNYQRVMLQSALWVDAILRGRKERWPYATQEALTRAAHWLFSMIDPASGRAPNLGANDGSHILPLHSAPYDDFRPTVQAAARAFLRMGLPPGKWDELSLWLGLTPSKSSADSDAYMAEHLRGRNSWGYLRASRFRSRLSHMDQLHFDLWRGGQNIVLDAGSYLYNAPPPWDNPLVTTRVHNTMTVDGQDQMLRGGRFLTLDWAPGYSERMLEGDERILGRMMAYHRGYQRLGIRHERTATVFADEHWEVRDHLIFLQPGEHIFRLHWLLADGKYKIEENRIELPVDTAAGPVRLRVTPDPRIAYSEVRFSIARAGERVHGTRQPLPFEGWFSPTYGLKVPALSVAVEVESRRSFTLVSEFFFD